MDIKKIISIWNASPNEERFPFIYMKDTTDDGLSADIVFDSIALSEGAMTLLRMFTAGNASAYDAYFRILPAMSAIVSFNTEQEFYDRICAKEDFCRRFPAPQKKWYIYTDGSHVDKQHGGRLGCGMVLVTGDKSTLVASEKTHLTQEYLRTNFGARVSGSNPTAELYAVLFALQHFASYIGPKDTVRILSDFTGVSKWMNGEWVVREDALKNIKNAIDRIVAKMHLEGRISYAWIPGHQRGTSPDARWNNAADRLAKGESLSTTHE